MKKHDGQYISYKLQFHPQDTIKKLSKEDEMALWKIIKTCDDPKKVEQAKEKLIVSQYPLLQNYLFAMHIKDENLREDLFATGLEICLKRFNYFNPDRGFRFATYIMPHIKKALSQFCKKVRNGGITYYPKTGYSVLEFDETSCKMDSSVPAIPAGDRLTLLAKLKKLEAEDKELIERYYFQEKKLVDIARENIIEKICKVNNDLSTGSTLKKQPAGDEADWNRMIKKEHDRVRQKLHRAVIRLKQLVNKE